jgi:hypothetical protein
MARIERFFGVGGYVQLRTEHPFNERISFVVLQPVHDPAESIDRAAHARVGSSHHGQLGFRATKERVNRVLFRAGASEELCIVGHCDKNLRAAQGELTGEISQGILKAD